MARTLKRNLAQVDAVLRAWERCVDSRWNMGCTCWCLCVCAYDHHPLRSQSPRTRLPTPLNDSTHPHTHRPLMERKAKPVEKEEFERVQRALRQDRYAKARPFLLYATSCPPSAKPPNKTRTMSAMHR